MWLLLLWIAALIIGIWVTTASFLGFLFWCEMKVIEKFGEVDDL
jgi:hypothetical protein